MNGIAPCYFKPPSMQSFALPDSKGYHRTLSDLYVRPCGVTHGGFHTSVVSPGKNINESIALGIDQLRLLRNCLFHWKNSKIHKLTFV